MQDCVERRLLCPLLGSFSKYFQAFIGDIMSQLRDIFHIWPTFYLLNGWRSDTLSFEELIFLHFGSWVFHLIKVFWYYYFHLHFFHSEVLLAVSEVADYLRSFLAWKLFLSWYTGQSAQSACLSSWYWLLYMLCFFFFNNFIFMLLIALQSLSWLVNLTVNMMANLLLDKISWAYYLFLLALLSILPFLIEIWKDSSWVCVDVGGYWTITYSQMDFRLF